MFVLRWSLFVFPSPSPSLVFSPKFFFSIPLAAVSLPSAFVLVWTSLQPALQPS
ncbi:hypothetical protein ABB37_05334 [Leptomonas pyrrhocoris]|uniref:Uncharacterized protein n=1 Tax=Leptomonas pyrrhocoris TaxID=157538 RepID=A0A0M9FZU2_LEPPY|nr:hypothetical protein ABB37_05334 [Leptomonas pyrrhocoris]KPA79510.1 hypothetical protein ABB37_05334 [Leptomonas pyrrhocoris]|eukprot:XP_015657949.1 hypothetical protein ABB37_05334 [Leptomonas pyrrhocoris]